VNQDTTWLFDAREFAIFQKAVSEAAQQGLLSSSLNEFVRIDVIRTEFGNRYRVCLTKPDCLQEDIEHLHRFYCQSVLDSSCD
jgi:hypothetical protein